MATMGIRPSNTRHIYISQLGLTAEYRIKNCIGNVRVADDTRWENNKRTITRIQQFVAYNLSIYIYIRI